MVRDGTSQTLTNQNRAFRKNGIGSERTRWESVILGAGMTKKGLRFSRPLLGPARLSAAVSAWGVAM